MSWVARTPLPRPPPQGGREKTPGRALATRRRFRSPPPSPARPRKGGGRRNASSRLAAGGGLGEDGQHRPVVLLEGPLCPRPPGGGGAGGPAGRVEQLRQAPRQALGVVRV